MRRLCKVWIWMVLASFRHIAHICVTGSTTEIPLNTDINVSPLLNIDRNEVDILLIFVEDPPLLPEYTKAFNSATLSTNTPTTNHPMRPQSDHNNVESIVSNFQQLEYTKSGKSRGGSTDAIVDNVLQAYKRFLDKMSKGSTECRNYNTLLLRALSALWAGRVVDSILHSFETPSIRKSFAKMIVNKFLTEELVLENDWLEHVEGVLCNSYYAIVKTVAEATSCSECKEIADEIVFTFFVEDLLTNMLSSHRETLVSDAVRRLLQLSGISNGKQDVWKALFSKKQNLNTDRKDRNEGKNSFKRGLLSEKSLADVFSGAVIGAGEKSRWELIGSDTSSNANQKRSITYDYEETDFAPFAEFHLVPLVSESEDDEYFDYENNWKQTSSKKSRRLSRGVKGSSVKEYSVDGYSDILSTEPEHLDKSVSPKAYDVTFRSTDYAELTLVARVNPDDVEKKRILDGKNHYHAQLKQNKTHILPESTKNNTKMIQGHKTIDRTNCSFSLSQENEEESKNSYTESMWSWFFSTLGSWIKFSENMKDSGQVGTALNSDLGTLDSSGGTKLSLSVGNQRTGTTITGETGLNLIRENKKMSYEDAVVVMELANELAKMINDSQGKKEGEWLEYAEDNGVDTQRSALKAK